VFDTGAIESKADFEKAVVRPEAKERSSDNLKQRQPVPRRRHLLAKRFAARRAYEDAGATLDDLREAVTTLEDTARIARRVLGGAYPLREGIEHDLRESRAALRARETPSRSA
jgi:hypothetical protein